jgi:3-hydroxyisobutyrate dehydrogenase-like beta-hydroxyacid dehydrogenase
LVKVGILHPGDMGSSLGAALVTAGQRAFWVREGRSAATVSRAGGDGLETVETLGELVRIVDVIISICPPGHALEQAHSVVAEGFTGVYVDANAVAPETAHRIESTISPGADFVDGGVIGPPARQAGSTRLYLSGARGEDIAALFDGSPVQACPLAGGPGAASALKMCYAAWTKGSAALLMAVAALARREGMEEALMSEWDLSQPNLHARLQSAVQSSASKAWRFSGEMQEIAKTFRRANMPDGFHLAAAEIYQRLAGLKNETQVDGETLLDILGADQTLIQPKWPEVNQ